MEPTASILIADDHDLVRHGELALIENHPGWKVCAEATNGREAVEFAEKFKPDVIVMDIDMPELNGLEATRQIKHRLPGTEILILTGYENEELVHAVFETGARSYIFKTDAKTHLIPAIESLLKHKPYFTTKVSEIVFRRYEKTTAKQAETLPGSPLTARERETVQLLAEGKSNKETAAVLGISIKTVETHRAAIMRKLGLENFSDLVRYAIRNQIIRA
jgi:DNA-binding NarL/FixJ family response regulator